MDVSRIFAILKRMNVVKVTATYAQASKRLLLLDYDGTLAGFKKDPLAAKPSPRLLHVLTKLTADPKNTVVIISGRPAKRLDSWLGDLSLGFSAEHGFLHKMPGQPWEPVTDVDVSWREPVRSLMDTYVSRLAGTLVGEKTFALSWHWRGAEDEALATELEPQLLAELHALADSLNVRVLRILRGNKVIEVHPAGFDKGTAAKYWLSQDAYDFHVAIGDDTTDEDLFRAMPRDSLTIKVGNGETLARERIDSPKAVLDLLETFASSTN